jgi:hypothetical protein
MGFGKSKQASNNTSQQTSTSSNQAFPFLQTQLGGEVSNASRGSNAILNLLGLNGATGQDEGFNRFRNSSGYDFIQKQGIDGITSSAAARGLLNSGSTLKGISNYSSNLASTFLDRYLAQLSGLSNQGLQAGSVLAGAGGTSNSQGTSSGYSSGKSSNFTLG